MVQINASAMAEITAAAMHKGVTGPRVGAGANSGGHQVTEQELGCREMLRHSRVWPDHYGHACVVGGWGGNAKTVLRFRNLGMRVSG